MFSTILQLYCCAIWNVNEKNYKREIFRKIWKFLSKGDFWHKGDFWQKGNLKGEIFATREIFVEWETFCLANQDILGNLIKKIRSVALEARE